jgi:hypothetical protein
MKMDRDEGARSSGDNHYTISAISAGPRRTATSFSAAQCMSSRMMHEKRLRLGYTCAGYRLRPKIQ